MFYWKFFNSIKETSRLRKEINRLLSKRMFLINRLRKINRLLSTGIFLIQDIG